MFGPERRSAETIENNTAAADLTLELCVAKRVAWLEEVQRRELLDGKKSCPADPAGFAAAYRRSSVRNLRELGVVGPIDLYAPRSCFLLMKWLSKQKTFLSWKKLERRWGDPLSVLKVEALAVCHTSGRGRKRILDAVSRRLRALRLCSVAGVKLGVERKCDIRPARRAVKDVILSCSAPHALKVWWAKKLSVVLRKKRKWIDDCCHAGIAADLKFRDVLFDDPSLEAALEGRDMCEAPGNWKLEKRKSPATESFERRKDIEDALGKLGLKVVLRNKHRVSTMASIAADSWESHRAVVKHESKVATSQPFYDSHARVMSQDPDLAIIPDDKRRTTVWTMPVLVYQALLVAFIGVCAGWTLILLPADEIVSQYKLFAFSRLSPWCARWLGVKLWGREILPKMYATIKSKCFATNSRNCKSSHGHSCCRKITSFWSWRLKSRWRQISRAVEAMIRHSWLTFESWSLKAAGREVWMRS